MKRILTFSLLAMLLACLLAFGASAETLSGTCGTNVTWTLDDSGTLTVSGTGNMNEYSNFSYVPWYAYRDRIQTVIIGNAVTSICSSAFGGCSNLSCVTISDSVTSIGDSAFSHCSSLSSVTIPDSVTSIGYSAFSDCTTLSFIDISDLSAWCRIQFYSAGSNPLSKGALLYLNGKKVTEVQIPEDITSISDYAFFGFSSLSSVTIPDSVTSIGVSAFYGCSSLSSVTIPDSVTSIGRYAFEDCRSLSSVTIPDSVTSIGSNAFAYCYNLSSVCITDLAAWYNITFEDSDANPLYHAEKLYLNGSLVTQLHLPDGIRTVKNYVFSYATGLTSVVIPKSVTVISQGAFVGCTKIKEIYYAGTAEEWERVRIGANNGSLETATVYTDYVPGAFKVIYHAGTEDIVTEMPAAGSAYGSYILPETIPVRVGYRFCGWALAADSTVADYQPGARLDIYQDTDFYAVWAPGAKYALDAITLMDGSYHVIDAIPEVSFIAEVQLTKLSVDTAGKLLLVTYDADGRMLELRYLYADTAVGKTVTFGAGISNPDGKVAKVKALVIDDFQSFRPLAEPVEVTKA